MRSRELNKTKEFHSCSVSHSDERAPCCISSSLVRRPVKPGSTTANKANFQRKRTNRYLKPNKQTSWCEARADNWRNYGKNFPARWAGFASCACQVHRMRRCQLLATKPTRFNDRLRYNALHQPMAKPQGAQRRSPVERSPKGVAEWGSAACNCWVTTLHTLLAF